MDSWRSNVGGVRTPVTPAALTPMVGAMNHVFLGIADFHR